MDRLLVITDRNNPSTIAQGDVVCGIGGSMGYELETLTTIFASEAVFPNGGKARSAYCDTNGAVPVLGDGGAVVLAADPLLWFDLSRAQKNRIDELYRYLMPVRPQGRVRECLMVAFTRQDDGVTVERLSRVFDVYCCDNGLRNRGVLPASRLDLFG
ncbi:MAG: hypothetical protein LUC93_06945 [Planctomycetaceae bacterium]|nr:hypothetical protein [Planctomycetaceae bacterium]